ncbi:hypothetical protein [Shewanella sp. HL-SH2]|uniref:hypothetical protein n=1 Tax=Shewanella sp. HL-SH2 TaxID=3436238 RepID=UPI003EBC675D
MKKSAIALSIALLMIGSASAADGIPTGSTVAKTGAGLTNGTWVVIGGVLTFVTATVLNDNAAEDGTGNGTTPGTGTGTTTSSTGTGTGTTTTSVSN